MTKRSFPWFTSKPKPKKPTKPTNPGAMDDNAMKRAKDRNAALKEAAGD
jgi:hypothetical protein